MAKALEGIRVLDFSRYIAGPHCGVLLADMGAEVIRVERPGGADDRDLGPFLSNGDAMTVVSRSRNKKGITLNLQSDEGKEVLQELVKHGDVVLENFGVGAKEAMGLGYDSLKKVNPQIILITISGFGSTGPYSQRLAFDPIAQALSGAMSYTGFPDGPPVRCQVPYVDFSTAIYAAFGTMVALYHRDRTGVGQVVELSLLDTAVSFVTSCGPGLEYLVNGMLRPQQGNQGFYSYSNTFRARDGWVYFVPVSNSLWRRFLRAISREDLLEDPRFKDNDVRFENGHLINSFVEEWVSDKTVKEVVSILDKARVPCGWINTVADMATDPQVKAREMIVPLEYPGAGEFPFSGVPIKLSLTPGKVENRAPTLGEHNEEVYGGLLGYSEDRVTELKDKGII